jgi:hypothetical protein
MSLKRTFSVVQNSTSQNEPNIVVVRCLPQHLTNQLRADLATLKVRLGRLEMRDYEVYMEDLSSRPTKSEILILPEDTVPLWHSHWTRTKSANGPVSQIAAGVNIRSLDVMEKFSGIAITVPIKTLSTILPAMYTESVQIVTTSGTHEMTRTTIQLSPTILDLLRKTNSPTGNSR